MIFSKDYNGNCWWCGHGADSREHKIKRTDFIHVFGKGPYQDKNTRPYLIKSGIEIPIQSPKSDSIKFINCICKKCNNDRSSRMDADYTVFIEYVRKNHLDIHSKRLIDLRDVFGNKWQEGKRNIFKYWVKHLSCQSATGNYEISKNIINFLNDTEELFDVNFLFQFREYNFMISNLMKADGYKFEQMFIGKTRYYSRPEYPKGVIESITGWYTLNWFSVNYIYEKGIVKSIYGGKNPLNEPIVTIKIVDFKDVPSLLDAKSNKEIFERMEEFDRGEGLEDSFEFLDLLKTWKNTHI